MITWIAEPGTVYTIHDEYTELSAGVKCTTGATWDPETTFYADAELVDANTIKATAPKDAKVCVTYTPKPMATPAGAKTVTNVATVNGLKLERTIDVKVDGGTDGDGTTPAPTPTPERARRRLLNRVRRHQARHRARRQHRRHPRRARPRR